MGFFARDGGWELGVCVVSLKKKSESVSSDVRMCACYACIPACMFVDSSQRLPVCMHVCMYTYTHTCMNTHTYMNTCTHTH